MQLSFHLHIDTQIHEYEGMAQGGLLDGTISTQDLLQRQFCLLCCLERWMLLRKLLETYTYGSQIFIDTHILPAPS